MLIISSGYLVPMCIQLTDPIAFDNYLCIFQVSIRETGQRNIKQTIFCVKN